MDINIHERVGSGTITETNPRGKIRRMTTILSSDLYVRPRTNVKERHGVDVAMEDCTRACEHSAGCADVPES